MDEKNSNHEANEACRYSHSEIVEDKKIDQIAHGHFNKDTDKDNNASAVHASEENQEKIEGQCLLHSRRTGAMSVTGQLYETKLLTLILLRFLNKHTAEFYLGANISGAGALDDLCFKYKPANSDKYIIVFLQAKHKVNPDKGKITMTDVQSYGGDFSVEEHFESYVMIRKRFTPKSSDIIFKGAYHDSRCYFVVYTPLKHDIQCRRPLELNDTNSHVKDLIETNHAGDIFQLEYKQAEFLTKRLVERNVKQLGKVLFELITKGNVSNMMDDKLIKTYHVVLAQNVVELIEGGADNEHRNGKKKYKFRREFFKNKEKFTNMFRESLYHEAVKNNTLPATENDIKSVQYDANVAAETISKIIGNVVTYDEKTNKLVLLEKYSKYNQILYMFNGLKVEPFIIKNAVNIKGQKLLESVEFASHLQLGNSDLTLKGNAAKIEKRLDFIATNLFMLLEKANNVDGVHVVEVDERMVGPGKLVARGVVEHDGGLGSALGNLLVLDSVTGALKFNASATLPEYANRLWNKLKDKHDEQLLTTYQFKFRVDCFPKTSFQDDLYEGYLVKDFIDQYWLCTGQAKEDVVECITKKDINILLKGKIKKKTVLRAKTDAVFLMIHDKVQKWWMMPDKAEYLTEDNTYLITAMCEVIDDVLLSVLNQIYVNKLKSTALEVDEAALKCLGLDKVSHGLVLIVSDMVTHTAVKLMQHYKHSQNCTFIDFNYFTSLMYSDLAKEVANTNVDALVIICKAVDDIQSISETLAEFIKDVSATKHITVITDEHLFVALKQELTCAYHEVKDYRNGLLDLSSSSREKILNESKVIYQGEEVTLKSILSESCQRLIKSHILEKLVNRDVIQIGKQIATPNYTNIQHLYIKRSLIQCEKRPATQDYYFEEAYISEKEEEEFKKMYEVKTLEDLAQNIVVITAPPGMGKSTFLTHLSFESKKKHPNLWIARINLLDHSHQFHKWQQIKKAIDKMETYTFLCKAVLHGTCECILLKSDNGVTVKTDNINPTDLLQAELFINKCNNSEVIFIFDGFDEICPLYEKEVIQLMKATAAIADPRADTMKKLKLWIASRSYNNVKHVIEREFGLSYSLEPLSTSDQSMYLEQYWKQHMKLNEFTYDQFVNVTAFMEYMRQFGARFEYEQPRIRLKPIHVPLHDVFYNAALYFQEEINNITLTPAIEALTLSWRLDPSYSLYIQLFGQVTLREYATYITAMSGTPLHMHIAAEYLQYEIQNKPADGNINKWDLDTNTSSLYKRFLETKLTKIRFEEKNCIDVSKPDSKQIHDKARTEFMDMHRILAFYAVLCKDEVNPLMSSDQLNGVKCMIDKIKHATEKTGVIDCIVDDVPRFVHLTFAEYFAADYICEALKTAYASQELDVQDDIWEFIMTLVILRSSSGVSGFVDYKLFNEDSMKPIVEDEQTEKMVLEKLLYQTHINIEDEYEFDCDMGIPQSNSSYIDSRTALDCAISSRLKATATYLVNCYAKHFGDKDSNFDVFKSLIKRYHVLWVALMNDNEEFVDQVINIIRRLDESCLFEVTERDRFSFSMFTDFSLLSNSAIVSCMKKALNVMSADTHPNIQVTVSKEKFVTFHYVRFRIGDHPHVISDLPVQLD